MLFFPLLEVWLRQISAFVVATALNCSVVLIEGGEFCQVVSGNATLRFILIISAPKIDTKDINDMNTVLLQLSGK